MRDDLSGQVIVFNGEIYNYGELRPELKSVGSHFSSNSDTEVLLKRELRLHWLVASTERDGGVCPVGGEKARTHDESRPSRHQATLLVHCRWLLSFASDDQISLAYPAERLRNVRRSGFRIPLHIGVPHTLEGS
ncbi:MAG: hypothetical protein IPH09_18740, partial [bacterium]|nr:hypothetical protein [bacterium]